MKKPIEKPSGGDDPAISEEMQEALAMVKEAMIHATKAMTMVCRAYEKMIELLENK